MISKTKKLEEIDPMSPMDQGEFLTLFAHLPLDLFEEDRLRREYWPMYQKFLAAEVDPKISWLATKQLFINKEPQIGERQTS